MILLQIKLRKTSGGKLDIIINNTGIASIERTLDKSQRMLLTNYYGVKTVNLYLIPLLRDNSRVINVASELGAWSLNGASKDLQNKYTHSKLTIE